MQNSQTIPQRYPNQQFQNVDEQPVVFAKIIHEYPSFRLKNGPLFYIKSNMNCSSKNTLYVTTMAKPAMN